MIDAEQFAEDVDRGSLCVATSGVLPVTSCVVLYSSSDGRNYIGSSDTVQSFRTEMNSLVDHPGMFPTAVFVAADRMKAATRSLRGKVTLEIEENRLLFRGPKGKVRAEIATMSEPSTPEEFLAIPDVDGGGFQRVSLYRESFSDSIKNCVRILPSKTEVTISNNVVLVGERVEGEGKIACFGVTGSRILKSSVKFDSLGYGVEITEFVARIGRDAVKKLASVLGGAYPDPVVDVIKDQNENLIIRGETWAFYTREEYFSMPDVSKYVEEASRGERVIYIEVGRKELIDAIKAVSPTVALSDSSGVADLSFLVDKGNITEGRVSFMSSEASVDFPLESAAGKYGNKSGVEVTIRLAVGYLADIAGMLSSDKVNLVGCLMKGNVRGISIYSDEDKTVTGVLGLVARVGENGLVESVDESDVIEEEVDDEDDILVEEDEEE